MSAYTGPMAAIRAIASRQAPRFLLSDGTVGPNGVVLRARTKSTVGGSRISLMLPARGDDERWQPSHTHGTPVAPTVDSLPSGLGRGSLVCPCARVMSQLPRGVAEPECLSKLSI